MPRLPDPLGIMEAENQPILASLVSDTCYILTLEREGYPAQGKLEPRSSLTHSFLCVAQGGHSSDHGQPLGIFGKNSKSSNFWFSQLSWGSQGWGEFCPVFHRRKKMRVFRENKRLPPQKSQGKQE
jgi:hypothetical protein